MAWNNKDHIYLSQFPWVGNSDRSEQVWHVSFTWCLGPRQKDPEAGHLESSEVSSHPCLASDTEVRSGPRGQVVAGICHNTTFCLPGFSRCASSKWESEPQTRPHTTLGCDASEVFFKILLENIYFNWKMITLQYCDGFCHMWTWSLWIFLIKVLPPFPPCHGLVESPMLERHIRNTFIFPGLFQHGL